LFVLIGTIDDLDTRSQTTSLAVDGEPQARSLHLDTSARWTLLSRVSRSGRRGGTIEGGVSASNERRG
jgi:hypothetical protein